MSTTAPHLSSAWGSGVFSAILETPQWVVAVPRPCALFWTPPPQASQLSPAGDELSPDRGADAWDHFGHPQDVQVEALSSRFLIRSPQGTVEVGRAKQQLGEEDGVPAGPQPPGQSAWQNIRAQWPGHFPAVWKAFKTICCPPSPGGLGEGPDCHFLKEIDDFGSIPARIWRGR